MFLKTTHLIIYDYCLLRHVLLMHSVFLDFSGLYYSDLFRQHTQ